MDNQGYKTDNPANKHDPENGETIKSETEKVTKKSKFSTATKPVRKSYNKSKSQLQSNKYTKEWFPPSGRVKYFVKNII